MFRGFNAADRLTGTNMCRKAVKELPLSTERCGHLKGGGLLSFVHSSSSQFCFQGTHPECLVFLTLLLLLFNLRKFAFLLFLPQFFSVKSKMCENTKLAYGTE